MSLVRRRFTPGVPVTLEVVNEDGSREALSYRLAYNFNAFAAIEERTGLNMLKGELFKNLNAGNLKVAFWAALLIHQPDYVTDEGFDAVGELLTMENMPTIVKAVRDAFANCLPKEQRDKMNEEGGGVPLAGTPAAQ